MQDIKYIAQEEGTGRTGGGPEADAGYPQTVAKQQGFLAIAFGLALGLTLIILYLILRIPTIPVSIAGILPTFWASVFLSIVLYFTSGLIIGTVIGVIYNLLLYKRFNLFGLDHTLD
jgi:hypothetical protein